MNLPNPLIKNIIISHPIFTYLLTLSIHLSSIGIILPKAKVIMTSSETTHRYLMKDVKLLSPLTYSPHNYTIQLPTAAKGKFIYISLLNKLFFLLDACFVFVDDVCVW